MKTYVFWLIAFSVTGFIWFLSERPSKPPKFNDKNCICTIIGEYAKNDYQGMNLLAHCIRNRGTLKGFYGYNAKHVDTEPKIIWQLAEMAWYQSAREEDPLRGATEFRSHEDLINAGSPKGFTVILHHKNLYFFRKKGGRH